MPPGRHQLRYEFEPTGSATDMFAGQGVPARSKLYVDDALVAVTELPYSVMVLFGLYGMTCGYDSAGAVDPRRWSGRFDCTAHIDEVTLDVSGQITNDEEDAVLAALLAQQ